ncbi:right-handed parallel beta-helix repeat-containing protein [Desertihabitans aurantiacus]|uniref:right-handed parallel beta-helix repeat-containing protein n=1 Tax=Desertihabitans aurantiacus TaxID=2282477 RepID=UPI000DF745C0|nr:right-handed parallel beta-helix repeat-containing protein [Desertihabitans aurantiacus]
MPTSLRTTTAALVAGLVALTTAVAAPPPAAAATTTYSASQGFSGTQGASQWTYESFAAGSQSRLTSYDASFPRWRTGSYPWVSPDALHPETSSAAARVWTAPASGTVAITGAVRKGDAVGDGVVASIRAGSTTLWSSRVTGTSGVSPGGVGSVAVTAGQRIAFVVEAGGSMSNDHTFWNPTITLTTGAGSTPPAGSLSVTAYGAVADDAGDDLAAFRATLAAARQQGRSVWVPSGTFRLSDVLEVQGVVVRGAGQQATTLLSTDPDRGSVDLRGAGAGLHDLRREYATTSVRDGKNEKNSITVHDSPSFAITGVHVVRASTAGIYVDGSSGTISGNRVEQTQADGIHVTEQSSAVTITDNDVVATGDDCIAVVGYRYQGGPSRDITIRGNDVGQGSQARGISVVGGEDVTIVDNHVERSRMAGIYISVEAEYDTVDTLRIDVLDNVVDSTPTNQPSGHANVLVYGSQGRMDEIRFERNLSVNATNHAFGVWGGGSIEDVYFIGNEARAAAAGATKFESGTIHRSGNIGF